MKYAPRLFAHKCFFCLLFALVTLLVSGANASDYPQSLDENTQTKPRLDETPPRSQGVNCVNKRGEIPFDDFVGPNGISEIPKACRKNPEGKGCDRKRFWAEDAVLWCPEDHPRIVHCDSIDDLAPQTGPTRFTTCLADGNCDAADEVGYDRNCRKAKNRDLPECQNIDYKSREGPQNRYHEFIAKQVSSDVAVEGCWGYDRLGKHRPYRLEILCCSFPGY